MRAGIALTPAGAAVASRLRPSRTLPRRIRPRDEFGIRPTAAEALVRKNLRSALIGSMASGDLDQLWLALTDKEREQIKKASARRHTAAVRRNMFWRDVRTRQRTG